MTFYTEAISNIDNSLLWQQNIDKNALPIVCKIGGVYYNISGTIGDSFIVFDVADMAEALNLSVKYAKQILFTDMARLAVLASKVGVPFTSVEIFISKGVKGSKNFEVLQSVASYPAELQAYVDEKNIPFKTLALISSLDNCIEFISAFVADKKPSMQVFKQFVENVADYKTELVGKVYTSDFSFPSKKSTIRCEIEGEYKKVQQSALPANVMNTDMFETSTISVSFSATNYSDYSEKVKALSSSLGEVATFYKLLEDNDIC